MGLLIRRASAAAVPRFFFCRRLDQLCHSVEAAFKQEFRGRSARLAAIPGRIRIQPTGPCKTLPSSTWQPKAGHSHHTGEKMTPDLAVRPTPERTGAYRLVVLAATEPVLNLPAGQARFDDIARQPIRIIGNDDVFPEHRPLPPDQRIFLAKGQRQTVTGLVLFQVVH